MKGSIGGSIWIQAGNGTELGGDVSIVSGNEDSKLLIATTSGGMKSGELRVTSGSVMI